MVAPNMRVIGIDPGTRKFGYGIIERRGAKHIHVLHGVIDIDEELALGDRLVEIERELTKVLDAHDVAAASVESIFFAKDASAAAKLGHARGVALFCCARALIPIFEYPPARVKRTVTGNGRSEKAAVAMMMQRILGLKELPRADAADALAIALTHLLGPASRDMRLVR